MERTLRATISAPSAIAVRTRRVRLGGMDDLASCLRAWRDRLSPADVGLPAGGYRRAPGLRREEVAQLTGLSVDYLARLEQGRATHPSPSVLAPLARTLRLTDLERDHLFRLAGQMPPSTGQIDRHITPSVHRILDRLRDVPVIVTDESWQLIAMNELGNALMGCYRHLPERERNTAWRTFTGMPSRVVLDGEGEQRRMREEIVADLIQAVARHPNDDGLRELVADLREASEEFAALWEARPMRPRTASRKTIVHPQVGPVTVDCDVLTVRDSDVRLVVYSAAPGSPDAQALELLAAIGTQDLTAGGV